MGTLKNLLFREKFYNIEGKEMDVRAGLCIRNLGHM